MPVVVIGDIVGSRKLADRDAAQRALEAAFDRASRELPAIEPIAPTTGDEFQGVFATLADALTTLLLVQLALPGEIGCRFGIGWGPVVAVASRTERIQDGAGWWSAREAIERVRAGAGRVRGRVSRARALVVVAEEEGAAAIEMGRLANAYLLVCDQTIQRMSDRARRLASGAWRRRRQSEMAAEEGITQSGVSRALDNSGAAAILAGLAALRGDPESQWS